MIRSLKASLFAILLIQSLNAASQGVFDSRDFVGGASRPSEAATSNNAGIRVPSAAHGASPTQRPAATNSDQVRRRDEQRTESTVGRTNIQPSRDPQDRLEFQDFVMQSTGRDLPIFGANLFRSMPDTFAPIDDIPVTSEYVIGPGDEILIRAWGQIDLDYSALVDRNGSISIPKVGVLNVAGLKAQDLNGRIRTAFERVFRNFELAASLGKLRSIQIFLVGQAKRPGTYTISSLSTLVTVLFTTGGPSSKGSLRNIQLKRGNKTVAQFDLYDLLVSGDKSKDVQLLPGDVIYIPPVGQLVAITGSVHVPAIYELEVSTSLSDVIRAAGGLATTAQGQKVTVERIEARKVRMVEEFALDSTGLSRAIKDGDLITVHAIGPRFDNAITLRGSVAQPGRFPWRQGMRIRDLIPEREALLSRDYWTNRNQNVGLADNVASILRQQEFSGSRFSVQDLNQRPRQDAQPDATVVEILQRLQLESEATRFVSPQSEAARVANPQQGVLTGQLAQLADSVRTDPARLDAARAEAMRLINQIRPPQREVNWDYAVVERISSQDLTTSLLPFDLGRAVIEGDPANNILLLPGDVITIFSKDDIKVPASRQTKYIRLEGEFGSAGVHQIMAGETLRQLVSRVGGFARQAYLFGGEFTRESTRIQQQKNLEDALNRLERDIQRSSITRAQNITTAEDAATLKQQADSQQALITRLRQIRPTGRIVLGLPEEAALRDLPDLSLEDGDRFYIPPLPSIVNVFGAVYNENSFIYRPERRVSDYLAQAGGATKDADRGSVYVLRADGSVVSERQSGFLSGLFLGNLKSKRLMPGDSIVVPEELDKTSFMRNLKDVAQIFYQFGLGAAALKVLRD